MKVVLLGHTQLTKEFKESLGEFESVADGQAVALSAVRTCYSSNKPSEIVPLEGKRYFGTKATDGKEGTEADRLIRHIVSSKHLSTLEHITMTFAIEGISRATLGQLVRHRVGFSYSVQSQRYVKFSSDSKSQGFNYVVPEKVKAKGATNVYKGYMEEMQRMYDTLIQLGIPQEDARSVLPNSAATNLVMTVNLRAALDFYAKRRKGKGAQQEITELAEAIKNKITSVEPWTEAFFGGVN